jgi:N4-(beta-N-acetylglucosaminyl)-L-asparaginase
MKRREFLTSAAAFGAVTAAFTRSPAVASQRATKPVVVASVNGNFFKNGGPKTCVEVAWEMMARGTDVLDALIAGVNIDELDPADPYVGYGGLPNAEGVVELDASCMHGPKRRAGGVAALEGVRTPSLVAKAVMELTDNHLLVGKGAQNFARNAGFTIEPDLNTETSRKAWLEWKRRTDAANWPDPARRQAASGKDPFVYSTHMYGTIHCSGVNASGDLCGLTSTSGRAFKIPGRVGDSPILGAGLYVDNDVGAAGSTGRGEANLYNLTSYLIVENMRRGMSPKDAGLDGLRRIVANTVDKRLLAPDGRPNFGINFYVLNKNGEFAGVTLYEKSSPDGRPRQFAACTEDGAELLNCEPLFEGSPAR